jgi:hypothetical protein
MMHQYRDNLLKIAYELGYVREQAKTIINLFRLSVPTQVPHAFIATSFVSTSGRIVHPLVGLLGIHQLTVMVKTLVGRGGKKFVRLSGPVDDPGSEIYRKLIPDDVFRNAAYLEF